MRATGDGLPDLSDGGRTHPEHHAQARAGITLLERVRDELGPPAPEGQVVVPPQVPLPSRLATGELAWASVSAVLHAAHLDPAALDPRRIATSYRSDRVLVVDGEQPPVWSPLSGFWHTTDGWLRTHGNYPHHAARLRSGLRLAQDADSEAIRRALAERTTVEAADEISRAGGLAVPVAAERPSLDRSLRETPLLDIRRTDGAATPRPRTTSPAEGRATPSPLRGMRVLDLTRVIAGPVSTRTLAVLGADVLRIDPPHLPELAWQHLDTGHGKRSALLDARSAQMQELLETADVVVLGYRPAALDQRGLRPEDLVDRYPGLVVAQLSAWGSEHPDRAGFDSLVQAASGISLIESVDGDRPGALPAQALDHSAGYLLAAAIITLLERRSRDGGSWIVRTSLRRIAAELLGMPRRETPLPEGPFDIHPHLAQFTVDGKPLVTARSVLPGFEFDAPHAWGTDQPVW